MIYDLFYIEKDTDLNIVNDPKYLLTSFTFRFKCDCLSKCLKKSNCFYLTFNENTCNLFTKNGGYLKFYKENNYIYKKSV